MAWLRVLKDADESGNRSEQTTEFVKAMPRAEIHSIMAARYTRWAQLLASWISGASVRCEGDGRTRTPTEEKRRVVGIDSVSSGSFVRGGAKRM